MITCPRCLGLGQLMSPRLRTCPRCAGQGMVVEPPASRRSDPSTSHDAEQELNTSGSRAGQQAAVLRAVRYAPGLTSRELAKHFELDRYQFARRLPELEGAGKIEKGDARTCSVTGRRAITWNPIDSSGDG